MCVRHDSFLCAEYFIQMCDTTHSYVSHITHTYKMVESYTKMRFSHMNESCHTHEWNMLHAEMRNVSLSLTHTHTHVQSCDTCMQICTLLSHTHPSPSLLHTLTWMSHVTHTHRELLEQVQRLGWLKASTPSSPISGSWVWCSVLQCVAACCCSKVWPPRCRSLIHGCIAVCCSPLQSVEVCCSLLQSVATVCCSLL